MDFIKTTDRQFIDHQSTDYRPLTTYPPNYVKEKDQILSMF